MSGETGKKREGLVSFEELSMEIELASHEPSESSAAPPVSALEILAAAELAAARERAAASGAVASTPAPVEDTRVTDPPLKPFEMHAEQEADFTLDILEAESSEERASHPQVIAVTAPATSPSPAPASSPPPSSPPAEAPIAPAVVAPLANPPALRGPVAPATRPSAPLAKPSSVPPAPHDDPATAFTSGDAPRVLGRYVMLSRLGSARDHELRLAYEMTEGALPRQCVLKRLISPDGPLARAQHRRFLTEAAIACAIRHPNLVEVHDFGLHDGAAYLARELVDGFSLRALQAISGEVGLPFLTICTVALQIAQALEYAHGLTDRDGHPLRLVHGEISPASILITRTGIVKLTEMSLSYLDGGPVRAGLEGRAGKMGYTSPEQLRYRLLQPATDIFALGVVLLELIVGQTLAWDGKLALDDLESAVRHACSMRDDVPPAFEALLVRMTALQPEARPSAAELAAQLLEGVAQQVGWKGPRHELAIRLHLGGPHTPAPGRATNDFLGGVVVAPTPPPPPPPAPVTQEVTVEQTANGITVRFRAPSMAPSQPPVQAPPPPPEPMQARVVASRPPFPSSRPRSMPISAPLSSPPQPPPEGQQFDVSTRDMLMRSADVAPSVNGPDPAALAAVATLKKLGIDRALGTEDPRRKNLILGLITSRLLEPTPEVITGDALHELLAHAGMLEVLELGGLSEAEVDDTLRWLALRRMRIEGKLAARALDGRTLVFHGYRGVPKKDGSRVRVHAMIGTEKGCPIGADIVEADARGPALLSSEMMAVMDRFAAAGALLVAAAGVVPEGKSRATGVRKRVVRGLEDLDVFEVGIGTDALGAKDIAAIHATLAASARRLPPPTQISSASRASGIPTADLRSAHWIVAVLADHARWQMRHELASTLPPPRESFVKEKESASSPPSNRPIRLADRIRGSNAVEAARRISSVPPLGDGNAKT